MSIPILIVNNDRNTRWTMRQSLEVAGYTVVEAEDVEAGLATLRASEDGMVVIFNVILFNNMITGTDGIAFLGAAAYDTQFTCRHAFVMMTPTPEQVNGALGRLLDHLAVPVIAEPYERDDLLRTVARSALRLLVSA